MSEPPTPRASIRRRLLLFLFGSLLLVVTGAATVTYWVALRAANNAYDRSLLDPAIDIANNSKIDELGPHVDLPAKALDALVFDQTDRVIFQVRSDQAGVIAGVDDLPPAAPIAVGERRYFDGVYRGESIRVAALRAENGLVVQVGETLHKRDELVREILLAELVPTLLIAAGAIALAWLGVSRGLLPLENLRGELMRRSPRDLRPLADDTAPIEVAPVVAAFNDLLHKQREAYALQRRFLGNAAHQLRTPLAGLQMHLELLFAQELPAPVRAQLERMHSATLRASRLANQLLALAKAESAPGQDRELGMLDLADVAAAAARDWAPRAHAQNIDLGFALEPAPIHGDPAQLPELVDNIIDNALRYTPAGGSVTVTTRVDAAGPVLSVEDSGPGIPAAECAKVIERFYRINGTPGDGSGLGLAIVHEIVVRHSGRLEILSRDGQPGAVVRVRFPLAAAATE